MINIIQSIFNEIAKRGNLKYSITKNKFQASYEDAIIEEDKFVSEWVQTIKSKNIETDQPSWRITLIAYELIPLILEHEAITNYIREQGPNLKLNIPIIHNIKDVRNYLKKERPYTSKNDQDIIIQIVEHNLEKYKKEVKFDDLLSM
ncbi:MAG: hypothetical protein ACEPOW_07480 [Bacteroidales bacterium]